MSNRISFHILRVGLATTFLWIGILILKDPEAWGGYVSPWAVRLLPVSLSQSLLGTAVLDIAIGFLLLIDFWVVPASAAAALHLIIVLTVSGITDITVRDIGLLAASVALFAPSWPFRKNKAEKVENYNKQTDNL